MDNNQIVSKMEKLIKFLNYHQNLYDEGKPEISDRIWDDAYFQLKDLEKKYPELIQPNSPTKTIIYQIVSKLNKVKHEYQPMLSLAKTKDVEELKSFIGKRNWIIMYKLDGLSCRLTYKNGKLERAETRGNGEEGEDITHNAMVLPSIPKRIPYNETLVVDGEIICDNKTFEKFNIEYSNPRNFAAGSIRLLDSCECEKRGLTFVAWDLIKYTPTEECKELTTLHEKLDFLNWLTFKITTSTYGKWDFDFVLSCFIKDAKKDNWPVDGLVVKWDDCAEYEAAGHTDHHFRGGIAYKFYDEVYQTKLTGIEFTMGRNGTLTPVAQYEDIEIDGSICNRASLHNLTIMTELLGDTPYIGQEIEVFKANMIVPQVQQAVKWNWLVNPVVEKICIPTECPICGQPLERIIEVESEVLTCVNESCEGRLINQLDHFVSKKGLDIKGLSKATLEKLVDLEWVNEPADLYHLNEHRAEWIDKPGFGQKSVDKILQAIEVSRYVMLSDFLSAIGIPQIGKVLTKEICKYIDDYQDFRDKINNKWDFTTIDGIAVEKQYSLLNFDYTKADKVAKEMASWGTTASTEIDSTLENMTIVITGHLNKFNNREAFINEIVNHGGKVVNSVSRNTDILINNDITSNSSKNRTAKELGVKILTEKDFCEKYLQI